MMEIKLAKDLNVTEDDYIKVLEHKTASLFETSAKVGAILGEGEEDEIHAMATFGNLLGIAYQIHDDLIDWNDEDRLFNVPGKEKMISQKNLSTGWRSFIYLTLLRLRMSYVRYPTVARRNIYNI